MTHILTALFLVSALAIADLFSHYIRVKFPKFFIDSDEVTAIKSLDQRVSKLEKLLKNNN